MSGKTEQGPAGSREPDRILLVDDSATNLQVLYQLLDGQNYKLLVAKSGEDALRLAKQTSPHLILLDIMMPPGIDGFETCRRLKAEPATAGIAVIFLSARDETGDKVKGLGLGAVDFITKPFQGEEVLLRVKTHLTIQRLHRELGERNADLARELRIAQELLKDAKRRSDGPLLGTSEPLRKLQAEIARLAAGDETVVLIGSPGTGKESVARAIHHASQRGDRAFIQISATMIQSGSASELGSGDKPDEAGGRFDLANGGTIYLDGLSRISLERQRLLQSALEMQETDDVPAIRIIIGNATNLDDEVQTSRILPDLHRRLADHQLRIPALAERREDIMTIAAYFAEQHARHLGKPFEGFLEKAAERLTSYRWPGNIRELRSVVERALLMAGGPVIDVDESLLDAGGSIGSYRLVKKLGEGGMGEVWLARHQLLARPAAVKLIRPEMLELKEGDDKLRKRFQREAQATARLSSPHTVELYDFGVSEQGIFYYVMECLHGMDLEGLVRKYGPVPPERAVHFLKQACRSLGEAHAANLLHRDIKPANLFSCRLGTNYDVLKVLDFGLVKKMAAEDATLLTAAGDSSGTPAYLAPELALAGEVDGRTDLYSLGCVAFWLLTGSRVFNEDNATKMILAHVQTSPPAPSRHSELEIPAQLDELVLRCLAKSPADRPRSAEDLWRELDAIELATDWTEDRAQEWWELHEVEMPGIDESRAD